MGQALIPTLKVLVSPMSDCSKYVCNAMHLNSKCCIGLCECSVDTESVELESQHSENSIDCCCVHSSEKH